MIRTIASRLLLVLLTTGLMSSSAWSSEHGAKGIFYNGSGPTVMAKGSQSSGAVRPAAPTTTAGKEDYMGLSYWVELVANDGQKKRVTTDYVFKGGDRIKLHVQSNRNGYLYLMNIGSTGRTHMLFPNPAMGVGSNAMRANLDYEVPYSSYIRFDENPGEERLLVMLSPTPMGDIAPTAEPRTATLTAEDAARLLMSAEAKGAKDLILEVDTTSAQPAGYAVAPVALLKDGGMITLQIKLKHQ